MRSIVVKARGYDLLKPVRLVDLHSISIGLGNILHASDDPEPMPATPRSCCASKSGIISCYLTLVPCSLTQSMSSSTHSSPLYVAKAKAPPANAKSDRKAFNVCHLSSRFIASPANFSSPRSAPISKSLELIGAIIIMVHG